MSHGARVNAAGGVIVRQTAQGETEVLLIHRPRRDDWTFPKGKVEPGENRRSMCDSGSGAAELAELLLYAPAR